MGEASWGELRIEETGTRQSNINSLFNGTEDDGGPSELLTRIDDPDYLQFINSCLTSDPSLAVFNGTQLKWA